MISEMKNDIESNVMPLLRGIIDDTKLLLVQEVALVKNDIQGEISKTKTQVTVLALGIGLCFIAALLFSIGSVHLLKSHFAQLSLWHGYWIVALLDLLSGAILIQSSGSSSKRQHLPNNVSNKTF